VIYFSTLMGGRSLL